MNGTFKKALVILGMVVFLGLVFVSVLWIQGTSQSKMSGGVAVMDMAGDFNSPLSASVSLESRKSFSDSAEPMGGSVMTESPAPEQEVPSEQKVIREATLSLRVENTDTAVGTIRGVAQWHKGDVYSVNISENGSGVRSGSVTIKVPTENFEKALAGVKEVATLVVRETISNQDVTEEFVDMSARLKNKKAEEMAFVKILEKAEKTTDIIAVTRELSRVRGEIEVMEGRLRFMESRTQMATITLQISEDQTVAFVETWRPWQEVKDAVNGLIKSMQGFVSFVIVLIVTLLPLAILYGLLLFALWRVVRWLYRKMRKKPEGQ